MEIKVEGYHIQYTTSEKVPANVIEEIQNDLHDTLVGELYDGDKDHGVIEKMYYEVAEDTSEETQTVEFDVIWKIIDWKEIAKALYKELCWFTGGFEAKQMYEKAIKDGKYKDI